MEEYDPEFIDGYIDMIFTNDVTRLLLNEHKCKKNADFLIDIHMKKDPALPHDVLMEVSCDGKTGWIHVVGNPPDMASFSAEKPANYIDDWFTQPAN